MHHSGTLHDWKLVAPWWAWQAPRDTTSGRKTRPIFQKYDSPNLVNEFLATPQRSLQFRDVDWVRRIRERWTLADFNAQPKKARLSRFASETDPSLTRKLFLDTHRRYYLVVVELHCEAPGFPNAASAQICEAGFVVRRVTADYRAAERPDKLVADLRKLERAANRSDALVRAVSWSQPPSGMLGVLERLKVARAVKERPNVLARVEHASEQLAEWVERYGIVPSREAWFTKQGKAARHIGYWDNPGTPVASDDREVTYPLYRLAPDPNNPGHEANHGVIYFGLVPTGSSATNQFGEPRFDPSALYELQCFVKRHSLDHARGAPCKCPTGTFWSEPTEAYQLASHFDLDGTSNHPVVIQMPNLDDLEAQARPSFGLGLHKPTNSLVAPGDGKLTGSGPPRSAGIEICFFALPVITIVATFLFELFLPLLVFTFGLFFLLRLKFCIPPSLSGAIGAHASLDLKVKAAINANVSIDASLDAALIGQVNSDIDSLFPAAAGELKTKYTSGALAELDVGVLEASATANAATRSEALAAGISTPSLTADLVWNEPVRYE